MAGGGKHSNASAFKKKSSTVTQHEEENSLALVLQPVQDAPIISSYNDRIRPLLDAVDKLRHLMITREGIQLPTIVVVGDQSSGKSSVLESLAGINLPRGQGICTRVPLIMRLQHKSIPQPELFLEFNGKVVKTDEEHVSEAINLATDEIAGLGKGISNTPLTLEVRKNGVPDLTMVDLPGITRVPVHGQPDNIYDQIREIIMEYITPEESIILNVLSATVDFTTCESIRMSQMVDKTGERTLAVVTKSDKAPEGLLEKVTADDVNIGLGYVCVRNRIGDESYEEARVEEARLFESHPMLSKIDKSMVGVPVLAQKLVQIQATSIARNLPAIVKSINDKLNLNVAELRRMPKKMSSLSEAMTAFMQIIGLAKESLRKILVRGEFDEYPDEQNMHCTARLVEMLNHYSVELHRNVEGNPANNFLMEEIMVLEEAKGIGLPNFLPRSAFLTVLQKKSTGVMEMVEMEKLTDYTCNPEYLSEWNKLMAQEDSFMKDVLTNEERPSMVKLEGFGDIEVEKLRQYSHVLQQAFDMKMRMTAYWKIVLKRLVDCLALHLLLCVGNLVNKEFEIEIVNELMGPGGGIERMLEESPSVAAKRQKINESIQLLKKSKEVVAKIMDKIGTFSD
uniref:Dynamin-type G domain-containing protein n=1 Tax=Fagus sylvatica TaxID=28930 RepID=A0A2N9FR68_FAGSY